MRLCLSASRAAAIAVAAFLLPSGPCRSEGKPRFAYVTNQGSETVSVVDLDTFKVTATIQVPGKPAGVAVSHMRDRVYVAAPDARDVVVIDTKTNTVVKRWPAGKGPLGIVVQPRTEMIFVADWYDKIVRVLDPDTGALVAEIEVGQSPSGMDYASADGASIVVADRDSNTISVIDGVGLKRTAQVAVGGRPFGITIDRVRKLAFSANVASDDVSVVDLAAGKVAGTVKVGRRPYGVALSPSRGFVTDQYGGTISVFDLASLSKTNTIEACDHPEGINYDASRKAVYVACWFDNKLIRIDAESLKVTGQVAVGDGPRAFGEFLK